MSAIVEYRVLSPDNTQTLRAALADCIQRRERLVLTTEEVLDEMTARRRAPEKKRVEVIVNSIEEEQGTTLVVLGQADEQIARIEAHGNHISLWLLPSNPTP